MPENNPYAPPRSPMQGPPSSPREAAMAGVCPQCGSDNVHKPSFTWWGGAIGPKLFNHAVCRSCSHGFNAQTGENNRGKIIAYIVIVNALVLVLVALYFMSK